MAKTGQGPKPASNEPARLGSAVLRWPGSAEERPEASRLTLSAIRYSWAEGESSKQCLAEPDDKGSSRSASEHVLVDRPRTVRMAEPGRRWEEGSSGPDDGGTVSLSACPRPVADSARHAGPFSGSWARRRAAVGRAACR